MVYDSLSKKQRKVLDFILGYYQEHNTFPNYREISGHLGQDGPSAAARYLRELHKKGYLKKVGVRGYDLADDIIASINKRGIPFLGTITAGNLEPIVNGHNEVFSFENLFGNQLERIFVLRVKGDSMIDMNINDGDYAFIKAGEEPGKGKIGAIDYNGETTLKRVFKEEGRLRLVPANDQYDEIVIEGEQLHLVRIIGMYLGHVHMNPGVRL